MAIISSREAFSWANTSVRSVAAFNVITLEHAQAIVWAAERSDAPVILQLSENAIAYHRDATAIAEAMATIAQQSSARSVLHLDHITQENLARNAVGLGFSSVMWDSSSLPLKENLSRTRDFVHWAHERDIWVEAELGEIGGKEGAHAPGVRTNPLEAQAFVEATRVDALAVAVGSSHAMATKAAVLDIDLIREIKEQLSVPLVLHGSSGVPDDMLVEACSAGMVKVNIGTALNTAATQAVRRVLSEAADLSDPRRYLGAARDAMADVVEHYIRVVSGPRV